MRRQVTYFHCMLAVLSVIWISCSEKKSVEEQQPLNTESAVFDINRGVNISHWLSQSSRRGLERENFITEKDFELIAEVGYDHVRIPIDEEQMWAEDGQKESAAFELLHDGIKWAFDRELKVIVDLHILRSHHFNAADKPLWTEAEAQENFFEFWRQLSAELSQYPTDQLAYELMNEPVADDPNDWNRLVGKALSVVRENEPQRFVVIGSNRWQSADTFDQLEVPQNDPFIILSFHFYEPFLLTHHEASWTNIADYRGPVIYPGMIVAEKDIKSIENPELKQRISQSARHFDKDVLEDMMSKPIQKSKELGLQLYCGEWGCLPTVPRESLLQWYGNMRSILEKHDIAWTNWDYKGGFGIVDRDNGDQKIDDLISVLLD